MTNVLNSIVSHWVLILTVLAIVHTSASSVLGVLNKPAANSKMETVWHYVQIVCGFGTKLAQSKGVDLSKLSGDAAKLAGK